jgi:hypothetical protein
VKTSPALTGHNALCHFVDLRHEGRIGKVRAQYLPQLAQRRRQQADIFAPVQVSLGYLRPSALHAKGKGYFHRV